MASPSFFSLMLDTSATTLKISSEFVTKHLKNKIPKGPITICANGGYSWRIKIKKFGESYFFENGWTNVVKDVHFMFGDFVLFRLVDKSTFKMFVYGKDGCEKSLPKKVKVEDDGSSSVDNVVVANVNVGIVHEDDVVDSEDEDDDDVMDDDDDEDEDDDDDDDEDVDDDVYEGKKEEEEDDDDVVVDIDGDDGDPFFISTISKANKKNLRLPKEFVEFALIEDKRSLILKNLDGQEWKMELRPEKVNHLEKLYISSGWADFQQSNDLSEGDECVFKYITSEGKILLAKVTKKKRPARQSQPSGRNVDVESEDEFVKRSRGNDDNDEDEDNNEDEDSDEDGEDDDDGNEGEEDGVDIDGNPFFTPIISRQRHLRLPKEFVGLPGIKANGTITLKNLKGEEWQIGVLLNKAYKKSERYLLSAGWDKFLQSNDISVGDKCAIKFIRNEGKFCLAKVTKKNRRSQPSGECSKNEVVKRKRGRELHAHGRYVDVESEDEYMETMKRLRGSDDDYENEDEDSDDDEDGETDNDNDDDDDGNEGEEDEEEDGVDIDGNPFFTPIISKSATLRLPAEFTGLPGINAGGTIMLKNLNGEECSIGVILDKSYKSERYLLSAGWVAFMRNNGISVGNKCIIKFIRKEGKLCLEKVSKKRRQPWKPQPSGQKLATGNVRRKRGRPPHEQGGDVDVASEDDCVELVKRPCSEDDDDDEDKDNDINDDDRNLNANDGESEDDDDEDDDEDDDDEDDDDEDTDNDIKDDDNNHNDNDGGGEDDGSGGVIDGDPFFALCIYSQHTLRLPTEFVGLPGINAGGTITLKNLKGEEWSVGVILDKSYRSKRYLLTARLASFLRSNDISVGDKCVIKFIRNEGKFCLAKVTETNEDDCVEVVKRPCGEHHDEEDNRKDDGKDNGVDDNKDNDDEDDRDGEIGDPSFSKIISKNPVLVLPEAFVGLPGIKAGGTIMLKNLKGEEYPIGLRLDKKYQKTERYCLSGGWAGFLRSNDISVGDECVIKFIRNEGKLCLAKVTKKKGLTRQAQPSLVSEVVKKKSGGDAEDDDDGQDDDDDNDGQDDIDAGAGDLSFAMFILKKGYLALPGWFVELPGIKDGGSILIKNLKGKEWSLGVRLNKAYRNSVRYLLSAGCPEFCRDNNLLDGDECVFKFIRNEGKLCLTKVIKSKSQLGRTRKSTRRIPDTEAVRMTRSTIETPVTEVVNRKRGRPRGRPPQ